VLDVVIQLDLIASQHDSLGWAIPRADQAQKNAAHLAVEAIQNGLPGLNHIGQDLRGLGHDFSIGMQRYPNALTLLHVLVSGRDAIADVKGLAASAIELLWVKLPQ
jgi:hypothetical protein